MVSFWRENLKTRCGWVDRSEGGDVEGRRMGAG